MAGKKGLGLLLLLGLGVGFLATSEQAKANPAKCEWEENLPEDDKLLLTRFMLLSGAGVWTSRDLEEVGMPPADSPGSVFTPEKLRAALQQKVSSLQARGFPKAAHCLSVLGEDVLSKPPTPPKVL